MKFITKAFYKETAITLHNKLLELLDIVRALQDEIEKREDRIGKLESELRAIDPNNRLIIDIKKRPGRPRLPRSIKIDKEIRAIVL